MRARRSSSLFAIVALESFFVASTASAPGEAIARDETTRFHETTAELLTPPPPRPTGPVVMIVLDGVRWQEVYEGIDMSIARPRGMQEAYSLRKPEALMPNLHRLMERGVALGAPGHGAPVTATGTFVSLPGYTEMFTGQRHVPCADNNCRKPHTHTFLDELRADAPSRDDVTVITSWPAIERGAALDPTKMVMSTGRDYGYHRDALRYDNTSKMLLWGGDDAFPYPGDDHYRPDYYTGKIATRYLEAKKPRFLFVGMGDGDEFAHKNDYRGYISALQQEDKIIGDVMHDLDAMGERGKQTTMIVTADHGRCAEFVGHGADCPESGRTWIVAAGGQVPSRGYVDLATERHLADIAPTLRIVLGLPPGDATENAGVPIAEMMGDGPAASSLATN